MGHVSEMSCASPSNFVFDCSVSESGFGPDLLTPLSSYPPKALSPQQSPQQTSNATHSTYWCFLTNGTYSNGVRVEYVPREASRTPEAGGGGGHRGATV